ncbi:chromate transporter [Bacteroidota bacterium]
MSGKQFKQVRQLVFLLDVFKLAITAFGGPQIHFTQFERKLVHKKNYLTLDELKELNSLCSMLPGPSSTQTITAIGFKLGGPKLAFLTLAVWITPACLLMTAFALILNGLGGGKINLSFLKFLQPMASGFIIFAAYRFTQMFVTRGYHWAILISSALLGILIKTPYVFPVLLLVGGLISSYVNTRETPQKPKPLKDINWSNLILFLGIFLTAAGIGLVTQAKPIRLFENSYRYGSLVFGGGHVLIPMMYNQLVNYKQYIDASQFLAGVGILQAMPGPVFSFAAFTGAMAMADWGYTGQLLGGIIGSTGIFLPGILLIFFVYPIWNQLKDYSPVKNAIEGINVVSAGLVITSAYLLFLPVEVNEPNMLVLLATLFLLLVTKVPSPFIVMGTILAGLLW